MCLLDMGALGRSGHCPVSCLHLQFTWPAYEDTGAWQGVCSSINTANTHLYFDLTPTSSGALLASKQRSPKPKAQQPVQSKSGAGCPYCNGKATCPCKSLATQYPDLVRLQWDSERNHPISPDKVACGSPMKRWWRCALCFACQEHKQAPPGSKPHLSRITSTAAPPQTWGVAGHSRAEVAVCAAEACISALMGHPQSRSDGNQARKDMQV